MSMSSVCCNVCRRSTRVSASVHKQIANSEAAYLPDSHEDPNSFIPVSHAFDQEQRNDLLLDPNPKLGPEALLVRLLAQIARNLRREDLDLFAELVEPL